MEAGEKVTDSAVQAWQDWENRFFDAEMAMAVRDVARVNPNAKAKPKRKIKVPISVRACRQGGLTHIRTLDKILTVTIGKGLAYFIPDAEDEYTGLVQDRIPPTLVLHLDEGSPAFCMLWFLIYSKKLRFVGVRDIFHREWNDTRLCLGDSDMWWVVLLTTVVYNLPYGPWESLAWWGKITAAAQDYMTRAGSNSPLFTVLYENICKDMGIVPVDTPEHRDEMFNFMEFSRAFTVKGPQVRLRRWFSWVDAAHQHDQIMHTRLLSLIVLAMVMNIYKDYMDVPLWSVSELKKMKDFADDDEDDGDQECPYLDDHDQAVIDGAENRQVRADEKKLPVTAQDDLKALRLKCKNSIFVALEIMCKDRIQNMVRIIITMIRDVRNEHADNAANCRGPRECKEFYIQAARGKVYSVMHKSSTNLQNTHALTYMGLICDFNVGIPNGIQTEHDLVKEQDDFARCAMTIWINLLKHRGSSMMYHTESWIGKLALICSPLQEDRDRCIRDLHMDFKVLLVMEDKAANNIFLQKMVNCSPFKTTIMKEIVYLLFGPHTKSK